MSNYDSEDVGPDVLMAAIAKPRMTVCFSISFAIHIVLLVLLSISFIGNCFKYGTIYPKDAIKQEAKELREKEEEENRKNILKRAEEAAKKKPQDNSATSGAPQDDLTRVGQIAEEAKAAGKDVPEVIKNITETSNERPQDSNVSLDLDL